jgi:hypothetical protein
MGGLELIERIERCHELLTAPVPLSVNDMVAIEAANPVKVKGERDAFSIAHELRGWSRGECKRRGVTISDTFATPISTLTWASVKMGKNDYEPVYFDDAH